jgi:hypothetical protein
MEGAELPALEAEPELDDVYEASLALLEISEPLCSSPDPLSNASLFLDARIRSTNTLTSIGGLSI